MTNYQYMTNQSNYQQPTSKGKGPCKFAEQCTRPGCFFEHPPGHVAPAPGSPGGGAHKGAGGKPACKFGVDCTRAGCYFSHPPERVEPEERQ